MPIRRTKSIGTKGPELVTASSFNRCLRGDGIGFLQMSARFRRPCGRTSWVCLPLDVRLNGIGGDTPRLWQDHRPSRRSPPDSCSRISRR